MNDDPLRILTVQQPWGTAIARMGKDVENRGRTLGPYRGPVGVHAGLAAPGRLGQRTVYDPVGEVEKDRGGLLLRSKRLEWPYRLPLGAILAVANLIGVHEHSDARGCYRRADVLGWVPVDGSDASQDGWEPRICSEWAQRNQFHHELDTNTVRLLRFPIEAKGALGLWRPDASLLAAIRDQIGDL